MKRILTAALAAAAMLFASCAPVHTTAAYAPAQSCVLGVSDNSVTCLLTLSNPSDKSLTFCVYGVYGGERVLGLDGSGAIKTETLNRFESKRVEYTFRGQQTIPLDVVIVGEYETHQ